jgi:hypothetical protein
VSLDPTDQPIILAGRVHAPAAGDDQGVEGPRVPRQRPRRETKSGGRHRLGPIRDHHRLVRRRPLRRPHQIVGGGEHLERAGHVEQLHPVEGQDLDTAGLWRKTRGLWHFRHILTG